MTNLRTSSTSGASYSRDRAIYSCPRLNLSTRENRQIISPLSLTIFLHAFENDSSQRRPTCFVIFVEHDRCRRIKLAARENRGVLCSRLKRSSHTRVKSFKYWPMPVTPLESIRVSGIPEIRSLE